MAWSTPRTWAAGEDLTAALLNTHVRDNLRAIGDPWATYTPTWTAATTNPAIGNGAIDAAYMQAGRLVDFRIGITFGSSTDAGSGMYSLTLPVAPKAVRWVFQGTVYDTSTGDWYAISGHAAAGSSTITLMRPPGTAGAALVGTGATAPVTLADGDVISVAGTYEAA